LGLGGESEDVKGVPNYQLNEIKDAKALLTMVGGKVVYER